MAHEALVTRGPHGGPLFASLRGPRQTGCSLEAIDMTIHERNVREAYRRYKVGVLKRPLLLPRQYTTLSPVHVTPITVTDKIICSWDARSDGFAHRIGYFRPPR